MNTRIACAALTLLTLGWPLSQAAEPVETVMGCPGMVAFWDFNEAGGQLRKALNAPELALEEMAGPIEKISEGPFGHSLNIQPGQWLRIPRTKLGRLNINGRQAQVTIMAWVKRERTQPWQAIAGVWDESRAKRQYCLFLNAASKTDHRTMKRTPCRDLFQGHVSSVGGPTPGEKFCITYASSRSPVPMEGWHCLALTYDGREVRLYLNGILDAADGTNPFSYAEGLFDGAAQGAEFTVGAVSVGGKPGNFFGGWLGGLAVYDRALRAEEVESLHKATALPLL